MLKALVLIGGSSSRMGSDKFLMETNGVPQYLHLYQMITSLEIPTFISCSENQVSKIEKGIPYLIDEYRSIGPIGGLATAIKNDPTSDWLLVACDLIKLQGDTIKDLVSHTPREGVITFQREGFGFPETTISIYCTEVFPTIEKAIDSQKYSLQGVLKSSIIQKIIPKSPEHLKNANTRADL